MQRNLLVLFLALCISVSLSAQDRQSLPGGRLGLGVRSTLNIFGDYQPGLGAGAQWKLSLGKRVNTQWFLDYISSREGENIYRKDYHIGWSVQFALLKNGFRGNQFSPYIMAGHCFDLTKVGVVAEEESPLVFSSAVQAGAGVSTFIHPDVELTLQSQYMVHLGKDVHADEVSPGHFHVEVANQPGLEGHLLTTFAINYYFLQCWNR